MSLTLVVNAEDNQRLMFNQLDLHCFLTIVLDQQMCLSFLIQASLVILDLLHDRQLFSLFIFRHVRKFLRDGEPQVLDLSQLLQLKRILKVKFLPLYSHFDIR